MEGKIWRRHCTVFEPLELSRQAKLLRVFDAPWANPVPRLACSAGRAEKTGIRAIMSVRLFAGAG